MKPHPTLGPDAVVEEYVESGKVSLPTEPLEIPLDPLLTQSIKRSPSNLEKSIVKSQVTFSADEEKGVLVFSPTKQSNPRWQQECRDQVNQYIEESLKKEEITIPIEAAEKAKGVIAKVEKENPGLKCDISSNGTVIAVAGETSSVVCVKEAIDNLCSDLVVDTASDILSREDFDFLHQVKCSDFPSDIECTFDHNTSRLLLKGPIGAVTSLKDSISDYALHESSPVMLTAPFIEFFETESGREKLLEFLKGLQCNVALHFNQQPTLTLHLLFDPKAASQVQNVISQLHWHVTSQAIPIPEKVVPIVSDLEDFIPLCKTIEQKYGVLIKHTSRDVHAIGFKPPVTSSLAEIGRFLNEKASPPPQSEMKVGVIVAKSLNQSMQGVQKCLQPFHVELHINKGKGILLFSPKYYLKPGWEEDCRSKVDDYIQSNVANERIEVPRDAYNNIKCVLDSEEDDSFVYRYLHNSTIVEFAGEPAVVESTKEKIMQICKDHALNTEKVKLEPEDYEYLCSQSNMKELCNKFQSVKIEQEPETHTLILSGANVELEKVKDYVATLAKHVTIPVVLDEAIIQFLASGRGKECLLDLLQEKRCGKYATFISESPMQLLLLCDSKSNKACKIIPDYLQSSTSVVSLKIPNPIIPGLPEFSKKKKTLEKEAVTKISVKGEELVIAGFNEGVEQAKEALSSFMQVKDAHLQPVEVDIDPLIAKCMQANITGLQNYMAKVCVNCELNATESTKASVVISPTKETKHDWKIRCKNLLTDYIKGRYLTADIEIPEAASTGIFEILHSTGNQSTFHFKLYNQATHAHVAGEKSVVREVQTKIKDLCRQKKTSKIIPLSDREYDFFVQVVQPKLSRNVTVQHIPTDHSVELSGSICEVTEAKKSIKEMILHEVIPVHLDEMQVAFLSANGKSYLETSMWQRKITETAVHVKTKVFPHTFELLCNSKLTQSVRKLAEELPQKLQIDIVHLSKTVTTKPVSQEFNKFCQQVENQHQVSIRIEQDTLKICGLKDEVRKVNESVEGFIKKKCTVKESLPIQKGMLRLFCGPMTPRWTRIDAHCKDTGVTLIQPSEGDTECLITLKGDLVEVRNIIQKIKELKSAVIVRIVPLTLPGLRKYFGEGEDGQLRIPGIEKHSKVCIEVCEVGQDMDIEVPELKHAACTAPKLVKECTAEVIGTKRIVICTGDITEFRAEVIVNAANEQLKHVGGVANAILKKGGHEIQVASDRYTQSHGALSAGDVWLTDIVGNLPCLALIHAVGPRLHRNKAWRQQLKNVCMNCLMKSKTYNSIALPAISAGVFGCPIEQCADILVSTAIEFCKDQHHTNLDDINFVLFNESNVLHFIMALKAYLPPQNIKQRFDKSVNQLYGATASTGMLNEPSILSPTLDESGESEESDEESALIASPSSLDCIMVQQGSILDVEVGM